MNNDFLGFCVVVAIVLTFLGVGFSLASNNRLQCIKLVADKPVSEIQLICGK